MIESKRGWRADILGDSEQLLLRAAGGLGAEAAFSAWRGFRERVLEGDEDIVELRLLPLVYRNLLKLGHPTDPYLGRAYAQSFGANARMFGEAAAVLRSLRHASIPTMVLKGAALLLAHYGDIGARPMSDLDILVPEGRITAALDVLEPAGWRGDPSRGWLLTESHASPLTLPSGSMVDLHRHAIYEARFHQADEMFFSDSTPLEVHGAPTAAMSANDQLLHSIVHGLRWSIARSPVWVMDAATILRGGSVNVDKTVARASALRLVWPLRQGLETVRRVFGGQDTQDALLRELRLYPSSASDRLEHWFRVREPAGIVGSLPNLWFSYRRSQPAGDPPLSAFPSFLRKVWRLGPDQSLVHVLVRKAWRRLGSRPPS